MARGKPIDEDGFRRHLTNRELAPNTVRSYMDALKSFSASYDEVNKPNVIEYKRGLITLGRAPKTINNRVLALNQYALWAGIPCDVKPIKTQAHASLENVITVEQKDRLLRGLKRDGNTQGWAMVLTLSLTGVRVGELVQLTGEMLERGWQLVTNKGKTRKVYAPKRLVDKVTPYYAKTSGPYLFFQAGTDGCRPITTRAAGMRLRKYAERYGVPAKVCHPHSFRHLFGQQFMKTNGNIALLADLMGHSNVTTTQIYARMSEEQQREELDRAVTW